LNTIIKYKPTKASLNQQCTLHTLWQMSQQTCTSNNVAQGKSFNI